MPRRADERNFQKPGRQHKTGVSGNANIFCHKHQMACLQSIALRESIRYTAMLRTNSPSSPSSVPQNDQGRDLGITSVSVTISRRACPSVSVIYMGIVRRSMCSLKLRSRTCSQISCRRWCVLGLALSLRETIARKQLEASEADMAQGTKSDLQESGCRGSEFQATCRLVCCKWRRQRDYRVPWTKTTSGRASKMQLRSALEFANSDVKAQFLPMSSGRMHLDSHLPPTSSAGEP